MIGYLSLIYFQLFLGVFQIESASWKGRQNKEIFHTALRCPELSNWLVPGWWSTIPIISWSGFLARMHAQNTQRHQPYSLTPFVAMDVPTKPTLANPRQGLRIIAKNRLPKKKHHFKPPPCLHTTVTVIFAENFNLETTDIIMKEGPWESFRRCLEQILVHGVRITTWAAVWHERKKERKNKNMTYQ